jgi:hypothetical protein
MLGIIGPRRRSVYFVAFLTDIDINRPRRKRILVIADNLSARTSDQGSSARRPGVLLTGHVPRTEVRQISSVNSSIPASSLRSPTRGEASCAASATTTSYAKTVKGKYAEPSRDISTVDTAAGCGPRQLYRQLSLTRNTGIIGGRDPAWNQLVRDRANVLSNAADASLSGSPGRRVASYASRAPCNACQR